MLRTRQNLGWFKCLLPKGVQEATRMFVLQGELRPVLVEQGSRVFEQLHFTSCFSERRRLGQAALVVSMRLRCREIHFSKSTGKSLTLPRNVSSRCWPLWAFVPLLADCRRTARRFLGSAQTTPRHARDLSKDTKDVPSRTSKASPECPKTSPPNNFQITQRQPALRRALLH